MNWSPPSVVLSASLAAGLGLAMPAFGGGDPSRPLHPTTFGTTITVTNESTFNAALARARAGDTIRVADGVYPQLTVRARRFAGPVRIVGTRKALIAGITFARSSNLVLEGVTITPPGGVVAKLAVRESSTKITVERVRIDGRDEDVGAFVQTEDGTADVTVRNSEFTNCGRGRGCVRPGARNLRVLGNRFYDCRSCTFIKGGGNGATVRQNSFDLAHSVRCTGGQASCPHNDHIHIMGGGPWTIVGNRFGDYEGGAAQVYANPGLSNHSNPIRNLVIESNIFAGMGGVAIRIGIGVKSRTPPPTDVRIVNNTIVSGRNTAVLLPDTWLSVAQAKRPLVANNILSSIPGANCARGGFVRNVVLRGSACRGDVSGNARLDRTTWAPTARSALVVDRAHPRYAPRSDFYGKTRRGRPDIGAIEFRP